MTAETPDDLLDWLHGLGGGPQVNRTIAAACPRPQHRDEPATWFYVEADPTEGVARLRCLACGYPHSLLDSAERWTYPPAWSCRNCAQPIAEVAYGLHVENGDRVTWLAVGVKCVDCGELCGVTDAVVDAPLDDLVATL